MSMAELDSAILLCARIIITCCSIVANRIEKPKRSVSANSLMQAPPTYEIGLKAVSMKVS